MAISGNANVAQVSLNNDIKKPLTGFLSQPRTPRQTNNRGMVGQAGVKKKEAQSNALGKQDSLSSRQQTRQRFLNKQYGIMPSKDVVLDAPATTGAGTSTTGSTTNTTADTGTTTTPAATSSITPSVNNYDTIPKTKLDTPVIQAAAPVDMYDPTRGRNLNDPVWGPGQRDYIATPNYETITPKIMDPIPLPTGVTQAQLDAANVPMNTPLSQQQLDTIIPEQSEPTTGAHGTYAPPPIQPNTALDAGQLQSRFPNAQPLTGRQKAGLDPLPAGNNGLTAEQYAILFPDG
jgi:hypothetical protein